MMNRPVTSVTVKICGNLSMSINRSTQILRFILSAALGRPKLAIAAVLLVLAALAGTMSYTAYLVIGVLAEYLGTGRFMAGLLLGVLLARFPKVSQGKLRVVGLLPKPVRRPLIVGLLALCLLHFLSRADYVPAAFTGCATAFLLTYPWLRRTIFDRIVSSVFPFAGRKPARNTDDGMVIDGEFRERKE
jgi:hypothetical protein